MNSPEYTLLKYIDQRRVIRASELDALGVPRVYLTRLLDKGFIEQRARGVYASIQTRAHYFEEFIEVSKRIPNAVICLLSALRFHELTTQSPKHIWVGISPKGKSIHAPHLRIEYISYPRSMHKVGVVKHSICGNLVPVYSPEKTIIDCFYFKDKVGESIFLEALKDALLSKRVTADQLMRTSRKVGLAEKIHPYVKAVLA